MKLVLRSLFLVLWSSAAAVCQLPSSACDNWSNSLVDCPFTTNAILSSPTSGRPSNLSAVLLPEPEESGSGGETSSNALLSYPSEGQHESFHWGRALFESFTFLAIEQAYVVKDDYHWVRVENGIPFNHYWRDYKASLSTWIHAGWDDGDPFLYSYVGHPVQGALTEYIQIQNDPQGRDLEFSNSKAYWWSRFKAFWWSAAYSTQWNIGPLSELTVEKYGTVTIARRAWNHDGSFPCYQHCVTGVGQVDLVTTPVGGALWVLTEDVLDKKINRRVESATRNRFLIGFMRCALNPTRSGANILHGKAPWYRASRDAEELYFARHSIRLSLGNPVREKN
jgi:hypothetical protein